MKTSAGSLSNATFGAEPPYQEALRIYEKVLGSEDPVCWPA